MSAATTGTSQRVRLRRGVTGSLIVLRPPLFALGLYPPDAVRLLVLWLLVFVARPPEVALAVPRTPAGARREIVRAVVGVVGVALRGAAAVVGSVLPAGGRRGLRVAGVVRLAYCR